MQATAPPIQRPSPHLQWAKPSADHVTSTVLAVASRRRSLFGSAAWCHPHPSVTQNVAQPAASGSGPVVDVIGRVERRGLLVSQLLLALTLPLPLWLLGALALSPSLQSTGGWWQLHPWYTWEPTFLLTCRDGLSGRQEDPVDLGSFAGFTSSPQPSSLYSPPPKTQPQAGADRRTAQSWGLKDGHLGGSWPWVADPAPQRSAAGAWPTSLAPLRLSLFASKRGTWCPPQSCRENEMVHVKCLAQCLVPGAQSCPLLQLLSKAGERGSRKPSGEGPAGLPRGLLAFELQSPITQPFPQQGALPAPLGPCSSSVGRRGRCGWGVSLEPPPAPCLFEGQHSAEK